ncbi:uncharacterized protein [Aegilops tauschii subsp. strangulata]|uniref:uncharacterized protein n=1 Tax=Aegilops tauschii subsp. strangulata TaxID=200361 RepID=UPI003CC87786
MRNGRISDFNLICDARDKSNDNLDHRMMARFRAALNQSELREIKLSGWWFTWSNEQSHPTLARLDRAYCDIDWDARFCSAFLQPLANVMSDHYPLTLTYEQPECRTLPFHFMAFWPLMEGFHDVVARAWHAPCPALDALATS